MCGFVRVLVVGRCWVGGAKVRSIEIGSVIEVVEALPSLKVLEISDLDLILGSSSIDSESTGSQQQAQAQAQAPRCFELVKFDSVGLGKGVDGRVLWRFLGLFPVISKLHLSGFFFHLDDDEKEPNSLFKANVNFEEHDNSNANSGSNMNTVLLPSESFFNVHQAEIVSSEPRMFEIVGTTSRQCLKKLQTRFCPCSENTVRGVQALLDVASNLEEVELWIPERSPGECNCGTSDQLIPDPFPFFCSLLSCLESEIDLIFALHAWAGSLSSVIYTFRASFAEDVDFPDIGYERVSFCIVRSVCVWDS